jgi:hypothetical protein
MKKTSMATLNFLLDNYEVNFETPLIVSPFNNVIEDSSDITSSINDNDSSQVLLTNISDESSTSFEDESSNHSPTIASITKAPHLQHQCIPLLKRENHDNLILLSNMQQAILDSDSSSFFDSTDGKDPVFVPTLEKQIPNLVNLYMLIPQLFRVKLNTRHKVLYEIRYLGKYASQLLYIIENPNSLKDYNVQKLTNLKKKFNIQLSRLLPIVIDTSSDNEDLNNLRLLLLNTRFFDKGNNHMLLIDITTPEKVLKLVKSESFSSSSIVGDSDTIINSQYSHSMNYDAQPIGEKQCIFKIENEDNDSYTCFGFDNSKQLFSFLSDCINRAEPHQLKIEKCSNDISHNITIGCGSSAYTNTTFTYIFSLDLFLPHNDTHVTLNSKSSKLLHLLTNKYMLAKQMKQYLVHPDPLIDDAVGFYPAFQRAVNKKIYELIDIKFDDVTFNFGIIHCCRPDCQLSSIFRKKKTKPFITCGECYISHFCTLCCGPIHPGFRCNRTR